MPHPDVDALRSALRTLQDDLPAEVAPFVARTLQALDPPSTPGLAGAGPTPDLDAPGAVAALLDHTELHPDAPDARIDAVCREARTHGFAAVCVHPVHVARVADGLAGSDVTPCTVIGFPHGANTSAVKAREAADAVANGARELDMVLPIGALKSGRLGDVHDDIRAVVDAVHDAAKTAGASVLVKVILETVLLTDAEKAVACTLAKEAGANYVKTSTGFAGGGAVAADVALMRQVVGEALGVKASGGVGSADAVRHMVAHGATRIGASGSVGIVQGMEVDSDY